MHPAVVAGGNVNRFGRQLSSPGRESLKPFDELSPQDRAEDEPCVEAIRRVARPVATRGS
jgi:hypothetical protein